MVFTILRCMHNLLYQLRILAETLLIILSLVDFQAERVVGVFMIKITSYGLG